MNPRDTAIRQIRKLRAGGDLVAARHALEDLDVESDDMLALYHLVILEQLDEPAAKQAAIIRLIENPSADRSDSTLALLMRQSERVCLPIEMTGRVLHLASTRQSTDEELRLVCRALHRRHAFKQRIAMDTPSVQLISPGGICLPWTLPNRWGFRDARQYLEDFNPFCLALHLLKGVIPPLRNDFRRYLDPATVMVDYEEKPPIFRRRNNSVQWRHNDGVYWTKNGFDRLAANLQLKIDNFRRSCSVGGPIAFLMSGLSPDAEQLCKLTVALSRATNRKDCLLILSNHDHDVQAHGPVWIDDTVIRFHIPYPTQDYRWHNLSVANSPEGLDFEESFATMLLSCFCQMKLRFA